MENQPSDCFEIENVSYENLPGLKNITKDYLFSDKINELACFKPNWDGMADAINKREEFKVNRNLLVEVLKEQYTSVKTSQFTQQNINLLKENNCFTFTTGHQLSLFTGPSYFFYKILSVIKLAQQAKTKFPEKLFVPVFWMATEDHDFDEIASTFVDGKSVSWKRVASGAVGRLNLEELELAFKNFEAALGKNPRSSDLLNEISSFISNSNSYAEFTFKLVNYLFSEYGLVILDADHPKLKSTLVEVIKEDIFHQVTFKEATATSERLKALGYEDQIHIREINFFYLKDGLRERIEKQGEIFKVVDSSISFDAAEMHHEIKKYPERFSPNVALRPVYQETILPNIAYVGGGAEVAYWLQLKGVFTKLQTFYPVILLRDSVLMLPQKAKTWLNDLGLSVQDIFRNKDVVFQELIKTKNQSKFDLTLQKNEVSRAFDAVKPMAQKIQPTLNRSIEGEKQKILKRLNVLEKKLLREEKKNQNVLENRLDRIFELAYPNRSLQERKANFLPYWVNHKTKLLSLLIENFDATEATFRVVFY